MRIRHLSGFLAVAFIASLCVVPPAAGEDLAKLDELFAAWNHPDSPGVVVAVVRPGLPPLFRAYGSANLEFRAPMLPESNFYLCSVSKQFAATAIELLIEDGKIQLTDEIQKYVPEVPRYAQPITIENLIHHTSGLRDYLGITVAGGGSFQNYIGPKEMLAIIARQDALNFEPGTEYSYSNSGYFLLAEVVARVSGKSLRAFSQERIFGPLGMTATVWDDDRSEVLPQRVVSYRKVKDTWHHYVKNFDSLGDGGVMSTAQDLVHWVEHLTNPRIGGPGYAAAIRTSGKFNSGIEFPYAYGLVHETCLGRPTLEHGGGMLGFRTHLMHFEDDGSAVIILGNAEAMDARKMARGVAAVVMPGGKDPEKPKPAPGKDYEKFFGNYADDKTGLLWTLRKGANDGVDWVVEGGHAYALTEVKPGVLTSVDKMQPPAEMEFAKNSVALHRAGEEPRALRRLEAPTLSANQLGEFAGEYWSASLAATFTVNAENDALVVRCKGTNDLPVRAVGPDRFANRSDFRFTRDASGKITGMTANIMNLRNIGFVRQ